MALVAAVSMCCCSSTGGATKAKQDSFGDPFITDAQGRAIRIGISATAAFPALSGEAPSGSNGAQAVPPLTYDYPIRGTGNPNDVMDDNTIWWQLCVEGGLVIGKVRGTIDSLPATGC